MGNNQSGEEIFADVVRKVGSVALAVSYFTPAAAITVPITAGVAVGGLTATAIGHAADVEDAKKAGKWLRGLAFDAAIDGISGGALEGVKLSKTAAEAIKMGCEVWSSAEEESEKLKHFNRQEFYIPTPDPQKTLLVVKNLI
ncbi:957_t:CDS:1 [Ambispora leptoticha]|uniref:957_t:CDS:1 n=1 Tax=Ambispora leptoticha TaxID=144679 RepID=A0A9N9BNH1_9GLOM|nr:957_t:CDS:1 [Ambispora leptoticha]